ncbi:MAG: hypothetical protein K0R49_817 [Burkholderiales bacterium]|jgi:hypothetical protein|nr:hypothetical protein [Burkholderiales bacterium]
MYREVRVTLAHELGCTSPVFSAKFADTNTVGKRIRYCIDQAGCGFNSQIYAVGDGASWISEQVDKQFGTQATYLIDFYHVSEYLSAASHECANDRSQKWLHAQQQLLKCGHYTTVLDNIKNYAIVN